VNCNKSVELIQSPSDFCLCFQEKEKTVGKIGRYTRRIVR